MGRNPAWAGIALAGAACVLGLTITAQLLSGRSLAHDQPFWLIPAGGGVLALLAVVAVLRCGRPTRVVLGGLVAVAGAIALGFRFWRVVDPYALPGSYTTTRPLVLGAAVVVTGLGLLAVLLPAAPAPDPDEPAKRRWPAGVVALVAVLVLGAAGAGLTVVVAQQRNVQSSAVPGRPFPSPPPVLDGTLTWQVTGGADDGFAVSSDGVAQYLPDGVRMLDPGTGRSRWSYRRRDYLTTLPDRDPTLVSDDGGSLVAAHQDLDAATGDPLGGLPADVNGGVLGPTAWPLGNTVLAVDEHYDLDAYSAAGRLRWTMPYDRCVYTDIERGPDGGYLVEQFCGGGEDDYWATLLDGGTGAVRWSRRQNAPFAVLPDSGGRIVLAGRDDGALTVRRLDPATGYPMWTDAMPTSAASGQFGYDGYRALYLAGGELLVSDPDGDTAGALAGIDPDTGHRDWTDENLLPLTRPDDRSVAVVASVAALPDGRAALLSGTPDGAGLAIRPLDPHTGTTGAPHPVALPSGARAVPSRAAIGTARGALLLTGVLRAPGGPPLAARLH